MTFEDWWIFKGCRIVTTDAKEIARAAHAAGEANAVSSGTDWLADALADDLASVPSTTHPSEARSMDARFY